MRKASEQEYFPYGSKLVCYIELTKNKEIEQVQNYVIQSRKLYKNLLEFIWVLICQKKIKGYCTILLKLME